MGTDPKSSNAAGIGCLAIIGIAVAIAFWRWLVLIAGIGLVVFGFVREKRPQYQGALIVGGVIVALFGVFSLVTVPPPAPTTTNTAASSTPAQAPNPEPATPVRSEPDFATSELTPDSVKAVAEKSGVDKASVTVKDGVVLVTEEPTAWDENDMVKSSGRTAVDLFEAVFANAAVKRVTYRTTSDFTDQYGKSSKETAVEITYSRATAGKVDWEGLKNRAWSDWKAPYNIADTYAIHPAVWKNLNKERIPLVGGTAE